MARSWRRRTTATAPRYGVGDCWPTPATDPAAAGRAELARTADAGGPHAVDRGRLEQLADDLPGLDVVDRRARLDDEPVRQRGLGERLDVVGDHVVAAEQPGERLAGAVQRDRAARRGAEVDVGVGPRSVDEPDDVVARPSGRRRSRGRGPAARAAHRSPGPPRGPRAGASASARRGSRSPRSAAGSRAGGGS